MRPLGPRPAAEALQQGRAVILNWSERATWADRHRLEAEIFRRWAGELEFNPMASALDAPWLVDG